MLFGPHTTSAGFSTDWRRWGRTSGTLAASGTGVSVYDEGLRHSERHNMSRRDIPTAGAKPRTSKTESDVWGRMIEAYPVCRQDALN